MIFPCGSETVSELKFDTDEELTKALEVMKFRQDGDHWTDGETILKIIDVK